MEGRVQRLHDKITDFGITRAIGFSPGGEPATTQAIGTPGYILPEVTLAGHMSPASDVFTFGVTVMQFLVGVQSPCVAGEHIIQCSIETCSPYSDHLPHEHRG